jgi:hypothetical protein
MSRLPGRDQTQEDDQGGVIAPGIQPATTGRCKRQLNLLIWLMNTGQECQETSSLSFYLLALKAGIIATKTTDLSGCRYGK